MAKRSSNRGPSDDRPRRRKQFSLMDHDQPAGQFTSELERAERSERVDEEMPKARLLALQLSEELKDRRNFPRKKVVYALAKVLGEIIGPVFELEAFLNACEVYNRNTLGSRIDPLLMRDYLLSLKNDTGQPVFPRIGYPHAHDLGDRVNHILQLLRESFEEPDDDPDSTPPSGGGGEPAVDLDDDGAKMKKIEPEDDELVSAIEGLAKELWSLMEPPSSQSSSDDATSRLSLARDRAKRSAQSPRDTLFLSDRDDGISDPSFDGPHSKRAASIAALDVDTWSLARVIRWQRNALIVLAASILMLVAGDLFVTIHQAISEPHEITGDRISVADGHQVSSASDLVLLAEGARRGIPARIEEVVGTKEASDGRGDELLSLLLGLSHDEDTTPLAVLPQSIDGGGAVLLEKAAILHHRRLRMGGGGRVLQGNDVVVGETELAREVFDAVLSKFGADVRPGALSTTTLLIGDKLAVLIAPSAVGARDVNMARLSTTWTTHRMFTAYPLNLARPADHVAQGGRNEGDETHIWTLLRDDDHTMLPSGQRVGLDGTETSVTLISRGGSGRQAVLLLVEQGLSVQEVVDRLNELAHP